MFALEGGKKKNPLIFFALLFFLEEAWVTLSGGLVAFPHPFHAFAVQINLSWNTITM